MSGACEDSCVEKPRRGCQDVFSDKVQCIALQTDGHTLIYGFRLTRQPGCLVYATNIREDMADIIIELAKNTRIQFSEVTIPLVFTVGPFHQVSNDAFQVLDAVPPCLHGVVT